MKIKFKILSHTTFLLVGMVTILSTSFSYESNAVELKISSVSCDEFVNRGYQLTQTAMQISPTETPIRSLSVNENVEDAEIETPVAGIALCDINEETKPYSEEDLKLLAGIIENEANYKSCKNSHQRAVGSVVLNRVKSDYFPDTIKEVIFQEGQYAIDKYRFNHPSKRAYKNAKYVLEHGSTLPDNCIFQSEFKQGDFVYCIFKIEISTTYICGKN